MQSIWNRIEITIRNSIKQEALQVILKDRTVAKEARVDQEKILNEVGNYRRQEMSVTKAEPVLELITNN